MFDSKKLDANASVPAAATTKKLTFNPERVRVLHVRSSVRTGICLTTCAGCCRTQ